MASKVLTIKTIKEPILRVTDTALTIMNVVYVAKANRKITYRYGSSRISYIGQTKTGISRIASSAAKRAKDILSIHGLKHLDFYIVRSTGKQNVKSWRLLERDLLIVFRCTFGEIPKNNFQGKNFSSKLSGYFRRERLETIIAKYSA